MLCHVACYLPCPTNGAIRGSRDRAVFAGVSAVRLMRLQEPVDAVVSAGCGGLSLTAVRCWVGILGRVRSVARGGSRMGVYLGVPVFGGLQEQRFGLPVASCCAMWLVICRVLQTARYRNQQIGLQRALAVERAANRGGAGKTMPPAGDSPCPIRYAYGNSAAGRSRNASRSDWSSTWRNSRTSRNILTRLPTGGIAPNSRNCSTGCMPHGRSWSAKSNGTNRCSWTMAHSSSGSPR